MREGAKQRLIGAVVVVALAVIFVPMLFERESLDTLPPIQESMPRAPTLAPNLKTEVFLSPQDSGAGGSDPAVGTVSQPLALPPAADLGSAAGQASLSRPAPAARAVGAKPESTAGKSTKAGATPESAAPRGANGGMPSWVIQVASVPTAEAAAELEARLRSTGFAAFVEKADVNGKVYYRVRVGPELDRARAEQIAARLRERHRVNTLITNYP
jgi:DedD protein